MDLLFAISTTSTESDENMAYVKTVLYRIIEKYGIRKIKYALLTFGQKPFVHFQFSSISYDFNRLLQAIAASKMQGNGASLRDAMEKAEEMFKEGTGSTSKLSQVLCSAAVEHSY